MTVGRQSQAVRTTRRDADHVLKSSDLDRNRTRGGRPITQATERIGTPREHAAVPCRGQRVRAAAGDRDDAGQRGYNGWHGLVAVPAVSQLAGRSEAPGVHDPGGRRQERVRGARAD